MFHLLPALKKVRQSDVCENVTLIYHSDSENPVILINKHCIRHLHTYFERHFLFCFFCLFFLSQLENMFWLSSKDHVTGSSQSNWQCGMKWCHIPAANTKSLCLWPYCLFIGV